MSTNPLITIVSPSQEELQAAHQWDPSSDWIDYPMYWEGGELWRGTPESPDLLLGEVLLTLTGIAKCTSRDGDARYFRSVSYAKEWAELHARNEDRAERGIGILFADNQDFRRAALDLVVSDALAEKESIPKSDSTYVPDVEWPYANMTRRELSAVERQVLLYLDSLPS